MQYGDEQIGWIVEEIGRDCAAYRARTAGSESDTACAAQMARQLEAWADRVETQPFTLHPHAFIGSIGLQGGLAAAAIVMVWLAQLLAAPALAWVGAALAAVGLVSWVGEYILYLPLFDRLYPRKTAQNVLATRKAAGETKRRVILAGHSDAAYEMRPFVHERTLALALAMVFADSGLMLTVVFGVLSALGRLSGAWLWVAAVYSVCSFAADLYFVRFVHWRVVADGANDNLTGCLTAMSVRKEMAEKGERLAHTDVCCLITSGEEAGLRGARAFAKAHPELAGPDTTVICLDTLREADNLMVYPRGINWTQKNSPSVCALLHRAGVASGVALADAGPYPGGTDAEAFSRAGVPAAALCGLSHKASRYYHTRYDTPDALCPEAIRRARRVAAAAVRLVDGEA